MPNKIIKPLLWIFCFELIGYLFGSMTQDSIATWYQWLNKSSLTPPSIVFPIVWSFLYAILALAGYLLWENRDNPTIKSTLYLYALQIIMNWAWTPLFFHFHYIAMSLCFIVIMILLSITIIILAKRNFVRLVFIFYSIWLAFAGYLNAFIWAFNP